MTDEEIDKIKKFIKNGDDKGLREFLKEREDKLKKRGVLSDYLYYYLQYKKDKLKEMI